MGVLINNSFQKSKEEEQFVEWIDKNLNEIKIVKLPEAELLNKTIDGRQEWFDFWNDNNKKNIIIGNLDVIHRWEVNYIRHELIEYDKTLKKITQKREMRKYYTRYKKGILQKIKENYPFLAYECDRQMYECKRVKRYKL